MAHIWGPFSILILFLTTMTTSLKNNYPILLIHGLDSSKETWRKVLPAFQQPAFAMDCRGCGSDPTLLKNDEFSLDVLMDDVQKCLDDNFAEQKRVILLGHSMGARIALAYAAKYPDRVACLIMEDMDVDRRPVSDASFCVPQSDTPFAKQFATKEAAIEALQKANYPQDRIDRWLNDGRIHQQDDGTWWSGVNPDFRRLCYKHIVDTDDGIAQCQAVQCPVHVLVGGSQGTICRESSLENMVKLMNCRIHRFPDDATHSIHSSHLDQYMKTMESIVRSLG